MAVQKLWVFSLFSGSLLRHRYINIYKWVEKVDSTNPTKTNCRINIRTAEEVKKMRPHLKMLCGNFLTYGTKFDQSGRGSARCKLCDHKYESLSHIVVTCPLYSEVRFKILEQFSGVLSESQNCLTLEDFSSSETLLTQLILDPSSMNLSTRVHLLDPILPKLFSLARDLCFAISKKRANLLNEMLKKSSDNI